MLGSLAFILINCIVYFAASDHRVSTQGVVVFIICAVFLSVFFGIKLLFRVRNKIMPLNLPVGYIFDMLCAAFALSVIILFLYDFILTLDPFNLVIFSLASAFLNAVVFARVN
jgi:Na+/H+-dicarboxylate symporter